MLGIPNELPTFDNLAMIGYVTNPVMLKTTLAIVRAACFKRRAGGVSLMDLGRVLDERQEKSGQDAIFVSTSQLGSYLLEIAFTYLTYAAVRTLRDQDLLKISLFIKAP